MRNGYLSFVPSYECIFHILNSSQLFSWIWALIETFSCIWPICKGGTTDIKNEHDLAGKGKFHHIIICNWRVQFQPSVFWGCRICKAKLSLWQQRRDVKSMCLGKPADFAVGFWTCWRGNSRYCRGVDRNRSIPTFRHKEGLGFKFQHPSAKNHGGLFFSTEKRLKINQHIIPEVHQSSVILRLNSAWSHMGTTFHVKFGTYRPCKFKTRHELMDE